MTRIEAGPVVLVPVPLSLARGLTLGSSDPYVGTGLVAGPGWPQPDTMGALRGALQGALPEVALPEGDAEATAGVDAVLPWTWLVVDRAAGLVIGDCGAKGGPDDAGQVEIGYGLAAPSRGRGLGRALVAALTGHLLALPGVEVVVAEALADNTPSRRCLESAGFTLTGSTGGYVWYERRGPLPGVRAASPR